MNRLYRIGAGHCRLVSPANVQGHLKCREETPAMIIAAEAPENFSSSDIVTALLLALSILEAAGYLYGCVAVSVGVSQTE